jgi:hypothetical protein
MDRNTTCTRCGTPVDLTAPHWSLVEQRERELVDERVVVLDVAPEPTYRHDDCPPVTVDRVQLAEQIRAAAAGPAYEGTHPARGPLIAVAAVLTLLDGGHPTATPRPALDAGRSELDGPCDTCDAHAAGPPCPGAPGWCPGRGTPPVAPGAIPAPREATS